MEQFVIALIETLINVDEAASGIRNVVVWLMKASPLQNILRAARYCVVASTRRKKDHHIRRISGTAVESTSGVGKQPRGKTAAATRANSRHVPTSTKSARSPRTGAMFSSHLQLPIFRDIHLGPEEQTRASLQIRHTSCRRTTAAGFWGMHLYGTSKSLEGKGGE